MEKGTYDVFVSFSFADQSVVEKVVKLLYEKYKITYWICTQEILAGDNYKDDIVDAIEHSKLVLFVQSINSIMSEEVPKEIAKALKEKKTVIPFMLDETDLEGALEYDLLSVHRIDATRPTLEDRVEELARQIYVILNKKTDEKESAWAKRFSKMRLLPTPTVMPKKVFLGRENVLKELREGFESGERVQFLYGIGGIGKTQIAKQYAKRYKDHYDTVIFATYGGSIRDMVVSDAPFTLEPEMPRFLMPDGTSEPDEDYFRRKLDKIKKITNERTLVVIDNFDVEDDTDLKELIDGDYHLLITTRCDYSRHFNTIKIEAIDSIDDLIKIFMQNYGGFDVEEDDPKLAELIELVNRHTYTVELLAQHMENSGEMPSEMIEALKKQGIMSLNEEVQGEDLKKRAAYENLLKMFKLFDLSEEEKRVLRYLSFMPIDGVNVRNFREWAELDSTKLIKGLEMKSWLIKNTEGIALHPVIRDVVRHELPADENNCREFIERFTDAIEDKKMWLLKKAEKQKYASVAENVLGTFDKITPNTEKLYYFTESLFSYAVNPEAAAKLAKRLYEYNLKEYGEENFITARSAFKLGWTYSFNTQLEDSQKNAIFWLEKADSIFKKITLSTSDELSRHSMTKTNLAKRYYGLYLNSQDEQYYQKAKEYGEDSILHTKASFTPGDFHYAKIAGAQMELAEILAEGGECERALELSVEAEKLLLEMFSETDIDLMYAYFAKAKALLGLKRYDEAQKLAQKSASGYEEYVGENHPKLYDIYELLGDASVAIGDSDSARGAYERMLRMAEKMYSPGAKQIINAREKVLSVN